MPTRLSESPDRLSEPLTPSQDATRHNLVMRGKDGSHTASTSKRKRADTATSSRNNHHRRRTMDTTNDDNDDDDEDASDSENDAYGRDESLLQDVYDPDQPAAERRRIQGEFRDLLRDVTDNAEEYMQSDSNGLRSAIQKAEELSKQVRQTTEAAIDSRLLVSTTDMSYRKTLRLTKGSMTQGVDLDQFVSRCITYMRQGGGIEDDQAPELSSTQRQRRALSRSRNVADEDDDVGDEGDMMNWSHLGRFAALPFIRRPALPGFLLGPLSVEKKARRITKRSAPFRPNSLTETRPEVLDVEDMAKKENDLTATCGKILQQLQDIQIETQETVSEAIVDDMTEEESKRVMHEHGLRSTGGIDLMRFVVNPKSFGQTVENMFYVSFLIRDGRVQIEFDEFGIPSLAPVNLEDEDNGGVRHGTSKHQAILSMDMETWADIVETLQLKESLIEHRKETNTSGPGAKGWYS